MGSYDLFGFALEGDEPDYDKCLLGEERRPVWKDIIANWSKWKNNQKTLWKEVADGIPQSLRRQAWLLLSGADQKMKEHPQLYEMAKSSTFEIAPHHLEAIQMDLHRTFPDHAMFEDVSFGQVKLSKLLKATVKHLSHVGYCQGMSFVAALLLMNMNTKEAFYVLVSIIEKHLWKYYSAGRMDLLFDSELLWAIARRQLPQLVGHVESNSIEPLLFATPWFTSLFSCYIQSWPLVMRFFDLYCLEMDVAIYRLGISILKFNEDRIRQRESMETLLPFLQKMGSRSHLNSIADHNVVLSYAHSLDMDVHILHAKEALMSSVVKSAPITTPMRSNHRVSIVTPSTTSRNRQSTQPTPLLSENRKRTFGDVMKDTVSFFDSVFATPSKRLFSGVPNPTATPAAAVTATPMATPQTVSRSSMINRNSNSVKRAAPSSPTSSVLSSAKKSSSNNYSSYSTKRTPIKTTRMLASPPTSPTLRGTSSPAGAGTPTRRPQPLHLLSQSQQNQQNSKKNTATKMFSPKLTSSTMTTTTTTAATASMATTTPSHPSTAPKTPMQDKENVVFSYQSPSVAISKHYTPTSTQRRKTPHSRLNDKTAVASPVVVSSSSVLGALASGMSPASLLRSGQRSMMKSPPSYQTNAAALLRKSPYLY